MGSSSERTASNTWSNLCRSWVSLSCAQNSFSTPNNQSDGGPVDRLISSFEFDKQPVIKIIQLNIDILF